MKIEFNKVPFKEIDFEVKNEGLIFQGTLFKENRNFVKLDGTIKGTLEVDCTKCLNIYEKNINEIVKFIFVDQPYKGFDENYDIIEIDNIIDLNEILKMEIESIKLDYNICHNCSDKEFEIEF